MNAATLAAAAPAVLSLPRDLGDEVLALYAAAGRYYHTVSHLADVVARFAEVARTGSWQHPHEVFLALLFHDRIYVPGRNDNEVASVALAKDRVATWLPAQSLDVTFIEHFILLTAWRSTRGRRRARQRRR